MPQLTGKPRTVRRVDEINRAIEAPIAGNDVRNGAEGRVEINGLLPGVGDGIPLRLHRQRHLDRNIRGPMDHRVPELHRDAHEIDANEIGEAGDALDILAEHMRSELESEQIRQRVFEDQFLLDRIVEALRLAEGSGGLEFERPVAPLAHVGPLQEAEQVLGVEHIEGIVRLSPPSGTRRRPLRRTRARRRPQARRKDTGNRGADATGEPLISFPSCPRPPFMISVRPTRTRRPGVVDGTAGRRAPECDISAGSNCWRMRSRPTRRTGDPQPSSGRRRRRRCG